MPTVLFVGAGPGAPDLITVRGMHLLQQADVVLYAGSLVNPALLDHCQSHCQCLDSASMDLNEQVRIMSEAAHAGHNVVRLHTGDPAMYGAINEQMRLLSEKDVAVQIVAGVSSVFAAAAALGAELTSPEVSQSVVLTRTPGRTPMPEGEDATSFARTGATLVFFLSTGKIDVLMQRLQDAKGGGLAPDTPAAVVYRASWPQERILRGTVSTIASQVEEAGFGRQALIFVGQALAKRPTNSKLYDGAFSHGYRNALPRESFDGRCALYAFSQKGTDKAMEIATALQLPCVVYSQFHDVAAQSQAFLGQAFLSQPMADDGAANIQLVSLAKLEKGALTTTVTDTWDQFDGHIFVGAAGIAVRAIAPLLESKAVDPAVLTCAESGAHIVSLTAGHLGGANRLSRRIARITGGQAVVSTATDNRNLPAFDEVAAALKARIVNPHALRLCNAALLEAKTVHFYGPRDVYDSYFTLPSIIYMDAICADSTDFASQDAQAIPTIIWDAPKTAPWLTAKENSAKLSALLALPHVLMTEAKSFVLGVGCRRGMDSHKMAATVEAFLAQHNLTADNIARIATCDVKADEAAILNLSESLAIPADFHTAAQLATVPVPNPSQRVATEIGTPSVCEAAALLSASYPQARLFAAKHKYADMTLALARVPHGLMSLCTYHDANQDIADSTKSEDIFADMKDGGVVVVGLGSGAPSHLTPEVAEALRHCDTVAGYTPYVDFIRHLITDKDIIQNGMMGEMARCRATLESAASGKKVCMVCSGDAGILAMAGLLLELRHNAKVAPSAEAEAQVEANTEVQSEAVENNAHFTNIAIKVLPGITAANIAAASLGAPLQNGFCLVSLSDLLVPTDEVRANLQAVAQSALPVTLYNPAGKKRRHMLTEAMEIFLAARGGDVLCATVRHAGRPQESKWIGRLADLPVDDVDMSTLVLVGGPRTMQDGDSMFEARGYGDKYSLDAKKKVRG